ncbi:MAG: hypothetical protein ACFCD0_20800 [Gemmataceae bacterium]
MSTTPSESQLPEPAPPFWVKQRQLKLESVGTNYYKVFGPNTEDAFVGLRKAENGKYLAYVRKEQEDKDTAATEPEFDYPVDAWHAAFELYRVVKVL